MKSMLGTQSNSLLSSSPIYGFGTEERTNPAAMERGGKTSPGPIYQPTRNAGGLRKAPAHSFGVSHRYSLSAQKHTGSPVPGPGQYIQTEAVGKQADSQKPSYSTWKFGTSTRGDQAKVFMSAEMAKTVPEYIDSPGPCAYEHLGSFGMQQDSRKPSNESYGMGTAKRFFYGDKKISGDPRGGGVPGPGTYMLHPATGGQVSSMKSSYPINSFPKADRERTAEKEYLNKQLLTGWGKASPGPAVYSLNKSVGDQVLSVKKNCPHYGFGTADRFSYQDRIAKAAQTPGPGSYSL